MLALRLEKKNYTALNLSELINIVKNEVFQIYPCFGRSAIGSLW